MTRCFAISLLFRPFASSSSNDEVVYNKFTISPFSPRAHPMTRWFTLGTLTSFYIPVCHVSMGQVLRILDLDL